MSDERTPLDELAASVADGRPVDWAAESAPADDELALDVEQLRVIAGIADLHRQLAHASQLETKEASVAENVLALAPAKPREGPRFGPLVIQQQLGSGSFGDVYRAWDTKLDREVALKVLRARAKGSHSDSIVKEGQMLAKVSHGNVMQIFGAEEVDGKIGIWGEFLHGRTLARIVAEDGPLSAEEAMVAGISIARALAAAHRVGVLHRDVKAQNVMRAKGGRIVLMDFGLGREFVEGEGGAPGRELAGTPLYLAPELFGSSRASQQSDLYSLGVLLFFLVTGTFPVKGASLEKIGEAHGRGERLRLQDLRPDLNAGFVQVVERALEPDPARRFESAGAMQAALVRATQPLATDQATPSGVRGWLAAIAAVLLAVAAASVTAFVLTRPGPEPGRALISIDAPPGTLFADSSRNSPTISPDGKYVAMIATRSDGKSHLWLYDIATGHSRIVDGSENASTPFWAPDSQNVAFFEPEGKLRTAGVAPGSKATTPVGSGAEPRGAAWNKNNVLLFPKGPRDGLIRRNAFADEAEREVLPLDQARGEIALMWPQFLPDGERFIYFVLSDDPQVRGIYLASLSGKTPKQLVRSDTSGVAVGDTVLFVQNGKLVRLPVDWAAGVPSGGAATFIDGVATTWDFQSVVSAADDGSLAYLPAAETSELVWFDRRGTRLGTVLSPGRYRNPRISRDGTLLAVQRFEDTISRIEIHDLDSGKLVNTIAQGVAAEGAVWGHEHELFYSALDRGRKDIYRRDFASDRGIELIYSKDPADDVDKMPVDWSDDHQALSVNAMPRNQPWSLLVVPLSEAAKPFALNPGIGSQVGGVISPDGTRVVYARRDPIDQTSGLTERVLWMSDFPSGRNQIRLGVGGSDLAWPSNREVSFFDPSNRLIVVDAVRPTDSRGAREKTGFQSSIRTPGASRNNYAWDPKGQHVLMNVPVTPPDGLRIVVTVPRRSSTR